MASAHASTSRGALMPGGHHFGPIERQTQADTDSSVASPPSLEDQVKYGLKRTYTMFLANYGQRPEADDARCAARSDVGELGRVYIIGAPKCPIFLCNPSRHPAPLAWACVRREA